MSYQKIVVPQQGEKITVSADLSLHVPDQPIVPYIEGDGIGVDITPVMRTVVDAAVEKAFGGKRKIVWMEIFAGEKANQVYGADTWLPDETLAAIKEFSVAIKGPLTTPIGGGFRSLNVTLRKSLGLFANTRACRSYAPYVRTKHPEMDVVIIRENEEDLYAGIEHQQTQEVVQCLKLITRPGCDQICDDGALAHTSTSM